MSNDNITNLLYNKHKLFKGMSKEEIGGLLDKSDYYIKHYAKNQVIASELSPCNHIGIVLKGIVEIKKIYTNGKVVTLARLEKGNIFGEVIVSSDMNRYPANVISIDQSHVLFIDKKHLEDLCHINKHFMSNMLNLLSNRILMLNKKITFLSYQTIRQKVAFYLLQEYKKNQKKAMFTLPVSRKDMSEQLGIPRPSLSREFIKLKDEGLIDYESKAIKIIDVQGLEDCLF
ncbi:Crp/Fnr family transcriptional regulator [Vallitalea okinawensis]|uniref:Crp/Fnr family transcriptional regulator n=1 Tax=Vallitalea okinawensis TaxID=2078660 RepID=UPI000CFBE92D|nr:Crp/Fnr family transcriptional regulator [Vallitalea okinawensis]